MNFEFTKKAWAEYNYWKGTDKETVNRINELLGSIREDPFRGIGKPEPLKHGLQGYWSRRITQEHRLVYKVQGQRGKNQKCIIIQCRFHY